MILCVMIIILKITNITEKILQTTKGLFYLAVCRICSVIFVLNVQYLRTPIFKLFQLRVTL